MLQFEASDLGNLQAFLAWHPHDFAWCKAYEWIHYTTTHWSRTDSYQRLKQALVELLRLRSIAATPVDDAIMRISNPSWAHVKSVLSLLDAYVHVPVETFDASLTTSMSPMACSTCAPAP